MFFTGDRLVKNLNLPEADLKAIQPPGVRKARCVSLQGMRRVVDEGDVVIEEMIAVQPNLCLGVGWEAQ